MGVFKQRIWGDKASSKPTQEDFVFSLIARSLWRALFVLYATFADFLDDRSVVKMGISMGRLQVSDWKWRQNSSILNSDMLAATGHVPRTITFNKVR